MAHFKYLLNPEKHTIKKVHTSFRLQCMMMIFNYQNDFKRRIYFKCLLNEETWHNYDYAEKILARNENSKQCTFCLQCMTYNYLNQNVYRNEPFFVVYGEN